MLLESGFSLYAKTVSFRGTWLNHIPELEAWVKTSGSLQFGIGRWIFRVAAVPSASRDPMLWFQEERSYARARRGQILLLYRGCELPHHRKVTHYCVGNVLKLQGRRGMGI